MPYEISQDCIACGNCSVVCPQGAIDDGYGSNPVGALYAAAGAAQGRTMNEKRPSVWQGYSITAACSGCGACAEVCPTGAISRK